MTARNYNGNGISWQVAHDVIVERLPQPRQRGIGLAPRLGLPAAGDSQQHHAEQRRSGCSSAGASGSPPLKGTRLKDSRQSGISIGHRDTDNLIRNNVIRRSGQVGVLFRPERGKGFAPHHNRLEQNRIEDSGPQMAWASRSRANTEGVAISGNEIRRNPRAQPSGSAFAFRPIPGTSNSKETGSKALPFPLPI